LSDVKNFLELFKTIPDTALLSCAFILILFRDQIKLYLPHIIKCLAGQRKWTDFPILNIGLSDFQIIRKIVFLFPAQCVLVKPKDFQETFELIMKKHRDARESVILDLTKIEAMNDNFIKTFSEIIISLQEENSMCALIIFPFFEGERLKPLKDRICSERNESTIRGKVDDRGNLYQTKS